MSSKLPGPATGSRAAIRPDWFSKSLAGGVGGLTLAIALLGLFAWLGPGGIDAPDKVQVVMWLVPPVWMTLFSLTYLFRSGRQAWSWLLGANLLAFAALSAARHLLGTG